MKNLQLIFVYIVGLYVPLISGTGFLLTMTNKKTSQDKNLITILQSQGVGAAIEISGLMLLLHGINSGKTELGININKHIIMEHSQEALMIVCLSLFISLIAILPTIDVYLLLKKSVKEKTKAAIGLFSVMPMLLSYINVGTENILIAAFVLTGLISLSYVIVTLNKNNLKQVKSLAFIGLGLFS